MKLLLSIIIIIKQLKKIIQITGVPKSTIHDVIKKFKNNITLDRVGVSGK